MLPRPAALALLLGALLLSGCSGEEDPVPVACRQGPDAVRSALEKAPGRVAVDGTPLSECIRDTTGGGALQEVGEAYVTVASELADEAARDPGGRTTMQLGFLIGAIERGKAGAQGVGYELGRRLRSELLRVDVHLPAFVRGERAGRRHG